jgi:uncharacterized protein (DUF433 family)
MDFGLLLRGFRSWPCDPAPSYAASTRRGGVSFVDLVEVIAIGELKRFSFSLSRIRKFVLNCQEIFETPRPLATLKFKVGGREVFVRHGPVLLEVGARKGMQAWDEVLSPFLDDLDYAYDLAVRWWPMGRANRIVVDPDYGFGLPVVEGSGVKTEIIMERFRAGDLEEDIADDFNLDKLEVQRALQFESRLLSAA